MTIGMRIGHDEILEFMKSQFRVTSKSNQHDPAHVRRVGSVVPCYILFGAGFSFLGLPPLRPFAADDFALRSDFTNPPLRPNAAAALSSSISAKSLFTMNSGEEYNN